MNIAPHSAILLLGPTGSGKTPLGRFMEQQGLWGRKCFHFDFGENLRNTAKDISGMSLLTSDDLNVIAESLETGRLLSDAEFHIARKILLHFIAEKGVGRNDLIVLNGLPRHVGQAAEIDRIVAMEAVIQLSCSVEVVLERIRRNSGGDRKGRPDDSPEEVARKIGIFNERTIPLLGHYRGKGVRIVTVEVKLNSDLPALLKVVEESAGEDEAADGRGGNTRKKVSEINRLARDS